MKILHCCLACVYVDEYSYQENILPRLNREDGNEVSIIASTETFVNNTAIGYVKADRYLTEYGVPIIRLPYVKVINQFLSAKIRKYQGLYREICAIRPDIIFLHDICFGSVGDVVKYKKNNPHVRVYADTHTAYYNSGMNWISLAVLHKIYYKHHVRKVIPYLEKYYYIGTSEKKFSMEVYGVPEERMEFFPLGGILPEESEYQRNRSQKREELQVHEDERLFLHSGKLDRKKKTAELLRAFQKVPDLKAKMIIIGSIHDSIKEELDTLMASDDRVVFLGWKTAEELTAYLCAADYYCQPGTPSVTMQNAICHRCIVMTYPTEGYEELDYGNFLWIKKQEDIEVVLRKIQAGEIDAGDLKDKTRKCAEELLDYKKLAGRYCG